MKNFRLTIAIIFTALVATGPTSLAQDRKLSLEFRSSANMVTNDLDGVNVNAGGGFEATVAVELIKNLSLSVGWARNSFRSDEAYSVSKAQFVETGYAFGLQFIHPI